VAFTQVRAGDCLSGPTLAKMISTNGNDWSNSVEVVPCNVSHIAEVFLVKNDLSKSQADSEWDTFCQNSFRSYVGVSSDYSIYSIWANTAQIPSAYSLQCFAIQEIPTKPGYKTLYRSIKGIKM
jgi:hypothetical protein